MRNIAANRGGWYKSYQAEKSFEIVKRAFISPALWHPLMLH